MDTVLFPQTSQRASASGQDKKILVTLIDGSVANVLLPTFLQSVQLVPGDLEKRLLVISIDTEVLFGSPCTSSTNTLCLFILSAVFKEFLKSLCIGCRDSTGA